MGKNARFHSLHERLFSSLHMSRPFWLKKNKIGHILSSSDLATMSSSSFEVEGDERNSAQRLHRFLQWFQSNGGQFRCSRIDCSKEEIGYGLYASSEKTKGVLLVTPLTLAITPMRVLQDPMLATNYGKLFEVGGIDDRLLMILFLLVERSRGQASHWAPYLDMLPTKFGTPIWFSEDELLDLKGTALYNATTIQLKNLRALFGDKVRPLVEQFLLAIGELKREIEFEDFLWANCIFWTRAMNIPCPHDFVFPKEFPNTSGDGSEEVSHSINCKLNIDRDMNESEKQNRKIDCLHLPSEKREYECEVTSNEPMHTCADESHPKDTESSLLNEKNKETVWVEGIVPGIDFCNHDTVGVAHWKVDGADGSMTGLPYSMYLVTDKFLSINDEVRIDYGDKGNEELLFLYGFVTENNPDDYLMVHFPKEALEKETCTEARFQLLEAQGLSLRWLLSNTFLQRGFFNIESDKSENVIQKEEPLCSRYSCMTSRKLPSYLHQMVFPEDLLAAFRVISMTENDINEVASLLEKSTTSGQSRRPTADETSLAIWEICGNSRAFQLLTDLLTSRLMELIDGTGDEDSDKELLERHKSASEALQVELERTSPSQNLALSRNKWACIKYRMGQKQLARKFLQEAEYLLELSLQEEEQQQIH